MKREELKAMGLTDEQVESVMAKNGAEVAALNTQITTLQSEKSQLENDKKVITKEKEDKEKAIADLQKNSISKDEYDKKIKEIEENAKKENEDYIYSQFLSLDINKNSIILLSNVIKEIARKGNCVIVGRAADYILREDDHLVKIFLYAPLEYRINKVMEIYNDSREDAIKYIDKSDYSRKSYYEVISNRTWGDKSNYDLCLDCKLGNETIKNLICNYVKSINE